ncbi:sigma-70 family RNA polymerase sigma factor [Pseudoxanthobacter soli]|nr:sigma-70 family RNA polymerase sigma factor [Pseudoxanthobacter soli]
MSDTPLSQKSPVPDADARLSALMVAAQEGDGRAYQTVLRESVPLIRSAARRQGVPPDRLDDVVQDVLLTLHQARHTYERGRSFTAWIRTIAQRRAIDLLRRQTRRDSREVHAPLAYENHPDSEADQTAVVDFQGRIEWLGKAIATLPAGQREAVEELALRQRSLAEAAAATGRSMGALKVNLHRALKALTVRLASQD